MYIFLLTICSQSGRIEPTGWQSQAENILQYEISYNFFEKYIG